MGRFNEDEWERLCDCCGVCCLYKVQYADTNEVFYTSVVCRLLNCETRRCMNYAGRIEAMPVCVKITEEILPEIAYWLPRHCTYRCVHEGKKLPPWHPLLSDPSPEARQLREKLADICTEEDVTFPSKERLDEIFTNTKQPVTERKLNRQLERNIIEDF